MASLGKELRKARESAELTQEQLALDAQISRNYVSLVELDEKSPTVKMLLKLCKAMDASASEIIAKIE